jgi:hypothetical protein
MDMKISLNKSLVQVQAKSKLGLFNGYHFIHPTFVKMRYILFYAQFVLPLNKLINLFIESYFPLFNGKLNIY